MRSTLRTILFSSALCLALTPSFVLLAQDSATSPTASSQNQGGQAMQHGMRGPMSPDQELSNLTKNLSLTSEQQTQLKPILQDRHDQLMQMHQDASISRQDKMAKMKSLDDESNSKLEAILKPEQKAKYEKMVADRKARMQERRAMHGGAGEQSPSGGDAQPQ